MLIKKPVSILATYNSICSLSTNLPESSTSLKRKRASTRQHLCPQHASRKYATIAGDGRRLDDSREQEQHVWPAPPKGQAHPTPYQIFQMKNNAIYSKARFYELVKIYHPDRNAPSNTTLSHSVKMERYRLVVAANNILSDPTKRSAYDRFGAGWNGRAEVGGRQSAAQNSTGHPTGPFSHNWTAPDDKIWRNATWEDWERYYYERAKAAGKTSEDVKPAYGGLYMQNGYFVVLVAILALLGSTANYNRAQGAGQYYVNQRDIVHDRTAKDLRRVKREVDGMGKREDQIDWFVRNREATLGSVGSDVEVLRQERIDRLLPDREVCKSESISEKD
jgi:hypothetical protein